MDDYEIGYRRPPKQYQFKKGVCPNPRGRGKRAELHAYDLIEKVLEATVEFTERGKPRKASRRELSIRRLFAAAVKGDIPSAALILDRLAHAKRGETGPLIVQIINDPDRFINAAKRRNGESDGLCSSERHDQSLWDR